LEEIFKDEFMLKHISTSSKLLAKMPDNFQHIINETSKKFLKSAVSLIKKKNKIAGLFNQRGSTISNKSGDTKTIDDNLSLKKKTVLYRRPMMSTIKVDYTKYKGPINLPPRVRNSHKAGRERMMLRDSFVDEVEGEGSASLFYSGRDNREEENGFFGKLFGDWFGCFCSDRRKEDEFVDVEYE
jgi:hypothetical protein